MKLTKYLASLLAIGLFSPALLAQPDKTAASAELPRREKAEAGPRKDPPRDAGQKEERRGEAVKKKVGKKVEAAGEAEYAKALKRAIQLKKKLGSGEELTPAEREEMRAVRAVLAKQGQPAVREKRPASAEKKVGDQGKLSPEGEAERAKALRRAMQLKKKLASGEELTEAERKEVRAIRAKLAGQTQSIEQPKRRLSRQDEAIQPSAKEKRPAEPDTRLQDVKSNLRQRRADLNAKLAEARRQLQAAAEEPKINEGAVRERANRIGQLEAELALLNAQAQRQARR
jgi:hypothetical protein